MLRSTAQKSPVLEKQIQKARWGKLADSEWTPLVEAMRILYNAPEELAEAFLPGEGDPARFERELSKLVVQAVRKLDAHKLSELARVVQKVRDEGAANLEYKNSLALLFARRHPKATIADLCEHLTSAGFKMDDSARRDLRRLLSAAGVRLRHRKP